MNLISIADKTPVTIKRSTTWTTLTFEGQSKFTLDNGRAIVHLQLRASFSTRSFDWPEWIEIQTVRHLPDGTTDETALQTVSIVKREQGILYTVEMGTEADKPLSFRIRHNGLAFVLEKRIVKLSVYR